MPDCWIFLLKRRRALSNVSFSPTRTSANPGSPPRARVSSPSWSGGAAADTDRPYHEVAEPPEHSRASETGQSAWPYARSPAHRAEPVTNRTCRRRTIEMMETLLDLLDDAFRRFA